MEHKLIKTMEDQKFIVRVYSPVLDDAERARRFEEIKRAAEALLKSKGS